MKKIAKFFLIPALIIGISLAVSAQVPPPPDSHGQSGNQPPGGGAPLGAGAGFMLLMAAAYGSKRIYNQWHKVGE
jgi:hypothetical protein